MSIKWVVHETGILRKRETNEKKEELFVFGYSCKLFRNDDKALLIDQGKHLIPWMGDEMLKIDREMTRCSCEERKNNTQPAPASTYDMVTPVGGMYHLINVQFAYDARGALHDLSNCEAPPGGYDWRVELTRTELEVEQLCDEERYRALHTDEDEEEMYKEEEIKRLHAEGYGQVGFNYDTQPQTAKEEKSPEIEEPFVAPEALRHQLPSDIVMPETLKQHAIIEKTASFIAHQGVQMEILIKAKQRDNPQFQFLNKESPLHPYYLALIGLVKSGKWPERQPEVVEEKPNEVNEEYLHPSLASTVIESAPSIPSIHYKPSADCDYTLLISKMRGDTALEEAYADRAPGEVAPPGTEPLPPRHEITRAPVMYAKPDARTEPVVASGAQSQQQYAAYYHKYIEQQQQMQLQNQQQMQSQPQQKMISPAKSTGLSLMKNYNTDSDSDDSDFDDSSSSDSKEKSVVPEPPEEVKVVIEKMAAYVARNGDTFADIVRGKNDPRFTFLEPNNVYHAFYKKLMQDKRKASVNGVQKSKDKANNPPVSFSIKKFKEPDPILPKPALPYESSSEDEDGKDAEKIDNPPKEIPKTNIPQIYSINNVPPVVVYKLEATGTSLPIVKAIEAKPQAVQKIVPQEIKEEPKVEEKPVAIANVQPVQEMIPLKVEKSTADKILPEKKETDRSKDKDREKTKDKDKSSSKEKRKHRDKKKDYRSKSQSRDSRRSERSSVDRERRKDRERERKKKKVLKEAMENEIISLIDNSDDMIDLTGELSDAKGECESEADRAKQQQRRQRAAEFLKKVGVDPAAAIPASSLASAMVDTLESIRKKKVEEDKKRREKRRHRDRKDYGDDSDRHKRSKRKYDRSSDEQDSDCDGSKRKKRKKEKKHSSKSKKKRRHDMEVEEDQPINIDLSSTLKELRNTSPTKELGLDLSASKRQTAEEEILKRRKKKEREYSEGEWSSDSDEDSSTTGSPH